MVQAILSSGRVRLLSSVPEDWSEGQRLIVEAELVASPEEIATWAEDLETAAVEIPEEDHETLIQALAQQKHDSKQIVRRQMGLE